ncbi:hypothetical protein AK812_SmicGene9895 [Symbiodinium microadriaticum]|uniref:Uncharacterized protein n=1 Tax=Symbiodinium microadriaticum TaxID=2951 RepID=A0A1Q9EH70_SYMMI|nr:hypothetical protein AK812_SmicGene9895 [Symbiodinium microadriaticum]
MCMRRDMPGHGRCSMQNLFHLFPETWVSNKFGRDARPFRMGRYASWTEGQMNCQKSRNVVWVDLGCVYASLSGRLAVSTLPGLGHKDEVRSAKLATLFLLIRMARPGVALSESARAPKLEQFGDCTKSRSGSVLMLGKKRPNSISVHSANCGITITRKDDVIRFVKMPSEAKGLSPEFLDELALGGSVWSVDGYQQEADWFETHAEKNPPGIVMQGRHCLEIKVQTETDWCCLLVAAEKKGAPVCTSLAAALGASSLLQKGDVNLMRSKGLCKDSGTPNSSELAGLKLSLVVRDLPVDFSKQG